MGVSQGARLGAAAFSLLLGSAGLLSADPPPRGVVLVTIDTLRADHLGCYGYPRPSSPFLDSLAQRGVLFENAFAASSMTAPCHASLFTGLYPLQHGVRINDQGLAKASHRSFRTLAEVLQTHGFSTAAFSGIGFLRSISNGFATVDAGSGDYHKYRQADVTIDHVLQWLSERGRDERFFVWIHLFDVHPPRRAPPRGLATLPFASPAEAERFAREEVDQHGVTPGTYPTPAALADSYALYDGELRFADSELSRLFDRMETQHLNDGTLWIVTADHGEGLGNHAWIDHVRYLYNEAVRVPLVVYSNGRWAGSRVKDLVRHVDVMPTVLDLLGLPFQQPGYTPPGRSIAPLLAGTKLPPAMAFSLRRPWGSDHKDWEKGEVFALQDLDWKFIAHSQGRDEFFDLRSDPLELRNLIDAPSPVKERLSEMSRGLFEALKHEGKAPVQQKELAVREELKSLGYVR